MAWRIVRQPNEYLACFSDVIDNFSHMNMSEAEALELCREHLFVEDARRKVQAGVDDCPPWKYGVKGNGTERWEDSIETIEFRHGRAEAKERLLIGTGEK